MNPLTNRRIMNIFGAILISIFIFTSGILYGQNGKIEITLLGNCGLFMTDGNLNFYVDFPYKSGAHGYMTYNPSLLDSIHDNSIFLVTHEHSDHFNKRLFKQTEQKMYGPWPVRAFLSSKRKYKFQEINDTLENFSIEKIRTKHKFSFKHYSYLINWNNKIIFISGDAENSNTIGEIKNMDLVFAPFWVLADAKKKNIKIDAKKIVVYHLRTTDQVTTTSPDTIIISKQNQKIEL